MEQFLQNFNYDEVFLRNVSIGLAKQFYRRLWWVNKRSDKEELVTVPFHYAYVGGERFLLDAFLDDIPGDRPELNYEQIPRGVITLNNWSRKLDEFSNPNVNLAFYEEKEGQLRRVIGKYRPLPLRLQFDIEIKLGQEIDVWKCSEAIMNFLWKYQYYQIDYKSIRLDNVFYLPNEENNEIQRQIQGLEGETDKSLTFSVEVHSVYPIPPSEQNKIPVNRRVTFKGNIRSLQQVKPKRKWLGIGGNGKGNQ